MKSMERFTKDKMSDNSLNGIAYDFSVNHNAIKKKKDILNIHNYLMKKHNMKMFRFIKHLFIVLFSFTGY